MPLCSHGASRLGTTLRRAMTRMSSFEGTWSLAADALRATMGLGRRLPTARPPISFNSPRVWQPTHGIVFGAGSPRSIHTDESVAFHSQTEDAYVMGPSNSSEPAKILEAPTEPSGVTEPSRVALIEPDKNTQGEEQHRPPRSSIPFKMSEEVFRAAKEAAPGSGESYWSHTLYRGPSVDGTEPKVKVHYCKSKHTTETVIQQHFLGKSVVGFDIEWKKESNRNSGIKKNVSLVQLACEDRIALFHIALYPGDKPEDLVAPSLKTIMEDPEVTKVGVAIKADCTRLRKYLDIDSKGVFELSHLYKLVKFSDPKDFKLVNKRLVSLAIQVQEHLHLPLFKGEVRGSDWSQPLQMDQIIYAASDSYAGVHLYDVLELKRNALDPVPPRPFHAELNLPIRLAPGVEIPTDDELDEEAEPDATYTQPKFSASYLATASEALEEDPDNEAATPATRSKSTPKPAIDPLVEAAAQQADDYRSSHQIRVSHAALRCYFLWHSNPSLSLPDIAALLRDPPLQLSTIRGYILEVLRCEKLPYEKEQLKAVLVELPKDVLLGRYRKLAKECGILEGEEKEMKRWEV